MQALESGGRGGAAGALRRCRAIARLVGLRRRELNGALVFVLGYSAAKERYRVMVHDTPRTPFMCMDRSSDTLLFASRRVTDP